MDVREGGAGRGPRHWGHRKSCESLLSYATAEGRASPYAGVFLQR